MCRIELDNGNLDSPNTDIVPLPSDLPVAELRTICLACLKRGDTAEEVKLFQACKEDGFFYLNLKKVGPGLLDAVQQIYRLNEDIHALPDEEKMHYDVDKQSKMKLNGYKPLGRNFGGIEGTKDGFETYSLNKNGLLGLANASTFVHPTIVHRYIHPLQVFTHAMLAAAQIIFSSLSRSLNVPATESFESYHRRNISSSDVIRLLKYHPQPIEERGDSHTPHTDIGSLTFLFTRQPGLQILPPGLGDWKWVNPRADHAIVNLGDTISMLTNKFFRSCLHKVGPLPGQAMDTRYSFAYLMRAEDETPLKGLESDLIPPSDPGVRVFTGADWLQRKYGMLRLETYDKEDDWVLLGERKALPK